MALTQQRKDEITKDMMVYLESREFHVFNVGLLAWAYKCSSNELTPLVRKWVKAGLVIPAYTGCTGVKNYRSGVGVFASLLDAAKSDPVARAAAIDYLLEAGESKDRRSAEKSIDIWLRG